MPDLDNEDEQNLVSDLIDHSIVACPQPVDSLVELLDALA
jgi:hypothetical protein